MTTTSVLKDHQGLRQRAATAILRLAEIADKDGGSVTHQKRTVPRAQLLRDLADKLANNAFILAVVGEFSRGKSSLINALLDQPNLLPTSIEPSTAAVTVLRYAPRLQIAVTFVDGSVRDGLTVEEMAAYALGRDLDGQSRREQIRRVAAAAETRASLAGLWATSADLNLDDEAPPEPAGPPPVQSIDIGLPSPFLRDGICLVDTPGIGSVNPRHGEATRDYIHRADAVLFLVNTDPVISQSECHFLAFLKDYVQRFLFVVTKIDRFSPRERRESAEYTKRTVEQYAGLAEPRLFPVSARLAQLGRSEPDEDKYRASGFPEFLEGLHSFLVDARGREYLSRQVELALVQLRDLMNATQMEEQGLRLRLEELPGHIDAAGAALRDGERRRRRILDNLDQRKRRLDALLDGFSPTALVRLELLLADEIERLVEGYDWEQLQRVSEMIPIFIRDLLATRLGPQFSELARQLVAMREEVLAACRDHFGEIGAQLGGRFGGLKLPDRLTVSLDFDPNEVAGRLQRIGTYTVGYTLALTVASVVAVGPLGAVVLLGGLLARQTMTATLRNDVKRKLKMSLAPALTRLLSDLFKNVREEVQRTATQFRTEVEEYLFGATAGVEAKLAELQEMAPVSPTESAERQARLRCRLQELDQLHTELSLLLEPEW